MAKITGLTGKLGLLLSLSLITACSLTVEDPEPGQSASPSPTSTPITLEGPGPTTQLASPGPTSTPVTSEGSEPGQLASPGPTSTPVTSEGPGPTQSASPGPTSTPVTSEGSESAQLAFPYPPSTLIKGVRFDWSSHVRLAEGSDNWAITWADDDHQYSAWGDGGGFGGSDERGRVSLGVAKIQGAFEDYEPLNIWGGHNASYAADFEGKSYGIIFIDGVLYMWVSPGSLTESYEEAGLFHSTDYGATWTPVEWAFVKEDGLIMPTILNFGKN